MRAIRFLACGIVLAALIGCQTVHDSGTMGAVQSYDVKESGRHWVRPHEVTYEIGELTEYRVELNTDADLPSEVVVFGYPQPGQDANRYVSLAAARLASERKADGVLIASYEVEERPNHVVVVVLQARPLILQDLGVVDPTRADKERFSVVVTVNPQTGITTTTTAPVDMTSDVTPPKVASVSGLSKPAWIAIDAAAIVLGGVGGGFLIADEELGAGIPLAVLSLSGIVKLVFDILR